MREGPSEPAGRSRFQTTSGGCGQKPWSRARKEKVREEPDQVTDRKRTAREPLMTCRKRRDDVETAGSRYCGNSLDETCLRAGWHPALRWPESVGWRLSGTWEPWLRWQRRSSSGSPTRARVRMRSRGAEQPVVAVKSPKRDGAKGLCHGAEFNGPTNNGRSL
jgi:hypothetical protein